MTIENVENTRNELEEREVRYLTWEQQRIRHNTLLNSSPMHRIEKRSAIPKVGSKINYCRGMKY